MASIKPIKTSSSISRKLSITVGLLCFAAFIVQGLGRTWGFEAVSKQIVDTVLVVSGAINIYFLGSTSQKEIQEQEVGSKEEVKK